MGLLEDRKFMALALKEARKGVGRTSPNPCVGALVVREGQILATGYHQKAGTPHAEIHALRRAGEKARGATLYVTLEPCNHMGRTPPCSHAVVQSGVQRVVVGMGDPNPLVNGSGNRYLQEHGIEVLCGILEEECRTLNRPFLKHITTGRPWVVMKAGVSLDGRLSYQAGQSGWLTGPRSLAASHRLRDRMDAILVGIDTIRADNPSLTTRLAKGKGKDPVRVILDTHLSIALSAKVLNLSSPAPTWIFCGDQVDPEKKRILEERKNLRVLPVKEERNGRVDLSGVLDALGKAGMTSLLVEGGGTIHGAFLGKRLVDHVNLFVAPLFAGDSGTPITCGLTTTGREDAPSLSKVRYQRLGDDLLISGDVQYP